VAPVVELVGTGASWRSSRTEWWQRLPAGTTASSNSSGGTWIRTGSGDATLGHGGEAGDGFGRSGKWRLDWRCRIRTAETAVVRRFMARARARLFRRGAWHARWRQRADEQAWRGEREADRWDPAVDFILN
jgi:hypothetical protein